MYQRETMSGKDSVDTDEFADLFGQIFDRSDRPLRNEVRSAESELSDEPEPSPLWGGVVLIVMASGLLPLVVLAWEVLLPLAFLIGWGLLNIWVMFDGLD